MPKALKYLIRTIAVALAVVLLVYLLAYSQRLYLKKSYPIKYESFVEKYSGEYNLDPYFVYAVIRTESDFVNTATSSINARGLMQVTEDTFNWISGRLNDKESSFDSMYNPETSVKYGVYLLSYLKNTLGSEQNILCGYHAGVNRAKQWLSDESISTNNNIITDKIPYEDTKAYVKKVMQTYNIYKDLYE